MGIGGAIGRFAGVGWDTSQPPDSIYKFMHSIVEKSVIVYEMTRIAEVAAIVFVANPKACGWGIVAGFASATLEITLTDIFSHFGFATATWKAASGLEKNQRQIIDAASFLPDLVHCRLANFTAPVLEEVEYRWLWPKIVEWVVGKIFDCMKGMEICGIRIDSDGVHIRKYCLTARTIALFVASIWFIRIHEYKPLVHQLAMVPGVYYWTIIVEEHGLLSSIMAHMVHNTFGQYLQYIFRIRDFNVYRAAELGVLRPH